MILIALVTLGVITMTTTLATLIMSGRISQHEDMALGLTPIKTADAHIEAEPAIS